MNNTTREKSCMELWAEREIEIACKLEREEKDCGGWDYGVACYESALKAFKSLLGDEHSGFSIRLTKDILDCLIENQPLSPIEDTDDIWEDVTGIGGYIDKKVYQCKRMSSLFKDIYHDGTVKYSDNDRCCCVDIEDPNSTYRSGFVYSIMNDMFPITMPYYPSPTPIEVYCESFLTDEKNGDFDTKGILYAIMPSGEKKMINLFFKEGKEGWVDINEAEYNLRKAVKIR